MNASTSQGDLLQRRRRGAFYYWRFIRNKIVKGKRTYRPVHAHTVMSGSLMLLDLPELVLHNILSHCGPATTR